MKRFRLVLIWSVILVVLMGGLHFWNAPSSAEDVEMEESAVSFPVMSTVATMKFWGKGDQIDEAVKKVRKEFDTVNSVCNIFDPESELSRLNAQAAKKPFSCSPELWEILTEARRAHRISGGAFDPTIRPLMRLWGFNRSRNVLPKKEEIERAKADCGMDQVVFDDAKRTVFFKKRGMSLDLGGIAKGWAVDRAVQRILSETGIRRGLVDLGGNIRCLPLPPPEKKFYTIGIRDPRKNGLIGNVSMLNESIATSGSYERYVMINGKRYTHIMNPKNGEPVSGNILSSSVVTPRAVDADALSTSTFILGDDFARSLLPKSRTLLLHGDSEKITPRIHGPGWSYENALPSASPVH